ncbi:diguanylate cyclase [Planctomycetota bacterium]
MSTEEDLRIELDRARAELRMLYEIGNAMRSTLKLDEILYMILTAITCREGLGFNRAMLFLMDDEKRTIDGTMAIGPASGEEASRVWTEMESKELTLDDLIYSHHTWEADPDKPLNGLVRQISLPLTEESGIIAQTCLEGMPYEITTPGRRSKISDRVLDQLKCNLFVTVPLFTRTRTLGIILADKLYSRQDITREEVRMLAMFANQAGRAIDNSRVYEETLRLAKTDSLTRLWNHATFHKRADDAVREAQEAGQPASFLMMDLDHFKFYNDNAGHAAGDEVIRTVGDVLREFTREEDTAARYGGEEFAVVLPHMDKDKAFERAEELRRGIEHRDFPKEEEQPSGGITVSIGVATFPADGDAKDVLLRRADNALYDAKRAGRNRTRTV